MRCVEQCQCVGTVVQVHVAGRGRHRLIGINSARMESNVCSHGCSPVDSLLAAPYFTRIKRNSLSRMLTRWVCEGVRQVLFRMGLVQSVAM